jgi:superfamily II DNA or RNA helicase
MIQIAQVKRIVSIQGIASAFLHKELSYNRSSMERVEQWKGEGGYTHTKEQMKVENVRLYADMPDGTILFQAGLLPRVEKFLQDNKMPYEKVNENKCTLTRSWDNVHKLMPDLEFRANQDVVIALVDALEGGQIVASAAFGKTFCIGVLCALYPDANIVVTTAGKALVRDTYNRLAEVFGEKQMGMLGDGRNDVGRITVSTYNSLRKMPPTKVDIVFVDECHRAASNMISEPISTFINAQKVFGFTASPEGRSDKAEKVTEALIGPVVLNIPYTESVKHGVVSPMQVCFVDVDAGADASRFKAAVTKKRHLYWKNLYRNKVIADAVVEYTKPGNCLGVEDPQVLIIVETAIHLEELLAQLPKDFVPVYKGPGKSGLTRLKPKEINKRFDDFKSQKLKKVIATTCWGIGVDFPDLDLIVMASGRSGPIDVIQFTGRCTRNGGEDKSIGTVLDFKDNWTNWTKKRYQGRRTEYNNMGWKIYG